MQKYDDMTSGISVVTGPEEEFRKQTSFCLFFFFFNILVLSELECREGCLLSNGVPGGFFPPELSL